MGMPSTMSAKAEEIRRVLSEPVVDLWKLRELALTEGGLVNDSLRKLAWPKLVGVNNVGGGGGHHDHPALSSSPSSLGSPHSTCSSSNSTNTNNNSNHLLPHSLDAEQIARDVSRVTWHLLTGNQRSRNFTMMNKHRKRIQNLLKRKQKRLGDFLNLVLVQSYGQLMMTTTTMTTMEEEMRGHVINLDGGRGMDEDRLRYYQGFHDVASIVMSALGGASTVEMTLSLTPTAAATNTEESDDNSDATTSNEDQQPQQPHDSPTPISPKSIEEAHTAAASMGLTLACQVLLQLSHSHMRDAMRSNFDQLNAALRLIIMPLAASFDPEVHSHLYDCEMEPFFALSWIITWFAHDVRDTAVVKRLFDFFIVSHPLMCVYMSVAMMIHPLNRIEILSTDCDFACVHHALADLPKNSSNVGWKYTPADNNHGGAGYTSGEDDDISMDASLLDQSCDDGEEDGSVISSSVLNNPRTARVPFQELIDLSISLMHKIPPRNLINLAKRYHSEITLRPLMAQASNIALLQPPPSWGLASHADSDWVLRQKLREEYGIRMNRHQRRNRFKLVNCVEPHSGGDNSHSINDDHPSSVSFSIDTQCHDEYECYSSSKHSMSKAHTNFNAIMKTHSFGKPSVTAIIASGTGPDGRAEARRLRKQRRIMIRSAAIVALSVFVMLVKPYFSSTTSAKLSQQQSTLEEISREICEEGSSASLWCTTYGKKAKGGEVQETEEKPEAVVPLQEKNTKDGMGDEEDKGIHSPEGTDDEEVVVNEKPQDKGNSGQLCVDDDESHGLNDIASAKKVSKHEQEESSVKHPVVQANVPLETHDTLMNVVKLPAVFVLKTFVLIWSHRGDLIHHLSSLTHQVFSLASHLQPYFDFLMEHFIKILQGGLHNVEVAWSKIAPVLQKELLLEMEGGEFKSAESAKQTWEKQGELYKNQWKKLVKFTSNARKGSKAGKENTSRRKSMKMKSAQ